MIMFTALDIDDGKIVVSRPDFVTPAGDTKYCFELLVRVDGQPVRISFQSKDEIKLEVDNV